MGVAKFQYLQKPGSARFDSKACSSPTPVLKFLSWMEQHQTFQFLEKKRRTDFRVINQRRCLLLWIYWSKIHPPPPGKATLWGISPESHRPRFGF